MVGRSGDEPRPKDWQRRYSRVAPVGPTLWDYGGDGHRSARRCVMVIGHVGEANRMENPPQIKLGDFTIILLSDGIWSNDGGCMLGVVPRELWQREHPADSQNRIRLNLTCPLIIKGNQAILVDTGIGNRLSAVERKIFDHQEGWLPEGLAASGMESGDITHILLSHLHFDHCGGI